MMLKFATTTLLLVLTTGWVHAGKPTVSLSIQDGKYGGIDALDPTLSWSNEAKSGDIDLTYGIESSIRPTSDIRSLPKSIWGTAATTLGGWGVQARADVDAQDFSAADLQIDATNDEMDLSVRVGATASGEWNVKHVQATKGFLNDGARITVTPRYDMETEHKDVVVTYSKDQTNAKLTASEGAQELTVSQQIDAQNRVAPTFSSTGDVAVEWERLLSDSSAIIARLQPNDSLNFEWRDADWTANVNCAIEGSNILGAEVSIKRDVSF